MNEVSYPAISPIASVLRRAGAHRRAVDGPTHENPGFELTWVERGRVEFVVAREVLAANEGAVVCLPPNIVNTPRWRVLVCHQLMLSRDLVAEAAETLGGSAEPPTTGRVIGAGERLTALLRLIVDGTDAGVPAGDPELGALVDALALALVRPVPPAPSGRRPDRRIRRALERIDAEYAERLTVGDLAEAAGMSRFPFLRAFRAQVGESPYQRLIGVRLARAAERLQAPASILDVALACGFTDPGRFARKFRARYGCSPRAYARR